MACPQPGCDKKFADKTKVYRRLHATHKVPKPEAKVLCAALSDWVPQKYSFPGCTKSNTWKVRGQLVNRLAKKHEVTEEDVDLYVVKRA